MDWVKARIGCSTEHAWITLQEQMTTDLDQWRDHQEEYVRARASFIKQAEFVTVMRSYPTGEMAHFLSVKKKGNDIVFARKQQGEEEKLIPSLNARGECRLLYKGDELEFWQASRLLLEPVLF